MWSYKWFVNSKQCISWKGINVLITSVPLFALVIFSLTWWLKLNVSSKWIPKWFWMEHLLNGTLLKRTAGWANLWLLLEKTTSWACLEPLGLKGIFPWYAHFDILNKYLIALCINMHRCINIINNWEYGCVVDKEFHCWRNVLTKVIYINKKEEGS